MCGRTQILTCAYMSVHYDTHILVMRNKNLSPEDAAYTLVMERGKGRGSGVVDFRDDWCDIARME